MDAVDVARRDLAAAADLQIAGTEVDVVVMKRSHSRWRSFWIDANRNVVATHPAGVSFFHPEHNHWHQSGVAAFAIKAGNPYTRAEVATGVKITFCFLDVVFTGVTGAEKKALPRRYFECNGDFQGLAVGWGDSYHQSTPLQELEVTGLPAGDYYLTHQADPDNHWLEGRARRHPASSRTSPG